MLHRLLRRARRPWTDHARPMTVAERQAIDDRIALERARRLEADAVNRRLNGLASTPVTRHPRIIRVRDEANRHPMPLRDRMFGIEEESTIA